MTEGSPGGSRWQTLYDRVFLARPALTLVVLALGLGVLGIGVKDFRLDASGDDLVLEHDADLRYHRKLIERYKSGDFAIVTYSPPEDLFSPPSLARLKKVRDELRALPRVTSVVTPLDVPLLMNKLGSIKDLRRNLRTLESPDVDIPRAVEEFRTSPIYRHLLVSEDMRAAALQVNFSTGGPVAEVFQRRMELIEKKQEDRLAPGEAEEFARVQVEYRRLQDQERAERHEDVAAIRAVIAGHAGEAEFILGGVPMIVDDILSFIWTDLKVFGVGMALLLLATLYVTFRRLRWVVLSFLCCVTSVFAMAGLLGFLHLDVSVVSSNFPSLQLILTLALAVHLVGRYIELVSLMPQATSRELAGQAVSDVFIPAVHAQLTTVVGFASLVTSDLLPIVNFGWMMSAGLVVSLIIIFVLLPAGMALLPKPDAVSQEMQFGHGLTMACAGFVERRAKLVLGIAVVFAVFAAIGCSKLEVENSFINYFHAKTEIHRGMKFIDRNLGGTTPLDITIDFKPAGKSAAQKAAPSDDEFGGFDEFEGGGEAEAKKYWFTTHKLETVERVHDYLDSLPETGKVLSLATVWKQSRALNEGKTLDDFGASILFNALRGRDREVLVDSYVSIDNDQVRITTRIKDSLEGLRRDALLKRIRQGLVEQAGLKEGEFRMSGLMVLYNNMLQNLYTSQIKTVAWTLLPLWLMFYMLFRSFKVSLVALIPSVIATGAVLGFMGLAGLPLDMMTITVVAVGLGIAVDNGTHYIHRFRHEFEVDGDYAAAMRRCHGTIGHNMIYSALPVILGFSILVLSNFVPSVLFGLLIAFVMLIALTSDLNLLPSIILTFKPFGPGKKK